MITSLVMRLSESSQRSGVGLVKSLKSYKAAWKVGKLAAKEPKTKVPAYMDEDYIAEVRAIAKDRGLDIPKDPTDW